MASSHPTRVRAVDLADAPELDDERFLAEVAQLVGTLERLSDVIEAHVNRQRAQLRALLTMERF